MAGQQCFHTETILAVGDLSLPALIDLPVDAEGAVNERPYGVVLFAHGSGSSRLSPRNNAVASVLRQAGLATVLFDLLTPQESEQRAHVFDIPLLAQRLSQATTHVRSHKSLSNANVAYFGASTGAGAALVAAAGDPSIRAIVSRGGRPDLAGPALASVRSPTLLIVGSRDEQVLDLNRQALAQLTCAARIEIVPGATHLFEEPGCLAQVANLAADWFKRHLIDRSSQ